MPAEPPPPTSAPTPSSTQAPSGGAAEPSRTRRVWASLRRPRVVLPAAAAILVGLDAGMVYLDHQWKAEDASLRPSIQDTATKAAEARSTAATLRAESDLAATQRQAGEDFLPTLETDAAAAQDDYSHVIDVANSLVTCINRRSALASDLWSRGAYALQDRQASIDSACKAAQRDYAAVSGT